VFVRYERTLGHGEIEPASHADRDVSEVCVSAHRVALLFSDRLTLTVNKADGAQLTTNDTVSVEKSLVVHWKRSDGPEREADNL
jgi:hypothetical protein